MSIKLLNDNNGPLIFALQSGQISIEAMERGLAYINNDQELPRNLRILEDSRNVTITFTKKDMKPLLTAINKTATKYEVIRHAVILDSPVNTVFALIFRSKQLASNYLLEVFSTTGAALKWLNSNLTEKDLAE